MAIQDDRLEIFHIVRDVLAGHPDEVQQGVRYPGHRRHDLRMIPKTKVRKGQCFLNSRKAYDAEANTAAALIKAVQERDDAAFFVWP